MSKRKLTRQQRWRVEKVQAERTQRAHSKDKKAQHALIEGHLDEVSNGLVTAHFGRQVEVEATDGPHQGKRQRCHVRANVESLVTGDKVTWRPALDELQEGVVEARQERKSLLARPDMRGTMKAVAANVDQLLLVVAPEPEPFANLIDRYLVAAEDSGLEPVLVINKWDLISQGQVSPVISQRLDSFLEIYREIGYQVLATSTQSEEDLRDLKQQLKGQISVFVGQSGVGKSSLINYLLPGVDLRVGSLSEDSRKGRHTTTTAKLFHFPEGGQLIDSPGIREFALGYLEANALAEGFREFRPFLGLCRFRDCSHQKEPGCALQSAVAEGKIRQQRFDSFLHLLTSL
ncbi:ribosome biogenesis GTPase [Marinospirillum celere]|uniref:Small ribosomal subunit biogenesis GTPase RsgA n=1 Tax=Marinospirillum celere TaxID=1122252 RepID=A0A1I1FNA7_9GAMM|nr:small ribosomal subunit biogenesis GTPase RsgA [Marinospirillum celere]SFC00771.1 ribosome biogenesis GTPase [Marinospirillum celere]